MNATRLTAILVAALAVSGCASYRSYERAREYELTQDYDKAVEQYMKALEVDPGNTKYRSALQRARLEASRVHFEKGKAFMAAGQPELAVLEYELTIKLDPTNQFAAVELSNADELLRRRRAETDETIEERKERVRRTGKAAPPELDPASDDPISLSFPRETPVKEIYRALGNAFGINILFDQQVKDDKITIELRDVTAQQALERVMQAGAHFYKVLDERSIIVVPDNPQARREYEDLVIQTFYLSNGDAEQVTNVVRTMIEARNVFPLKALNAITIRDTADKVRIAQEIIEANDKAKAEVVVAVELVQLDVTKARDVGANLAGLGGAIRAFSTEGEAIGAITMDELRSLTSNNFAFTMPNIAYSFLKSNTEAQVLARPQLRISEGENATLHIGSKVPLPVSTFTSANPTQGGTFAPVTSYTYNDVGIKISIEPRVHHNREVTLKLKVEVSAISGFAPDTNPPQPIISTRTIESVIRLQDGETNFLAGLIQEDEADTLNGTPFLSDVPLLGRIFSRESKTFKRTDVVLTMTPHIIRIANITDDDLSPMWVGTGTNLTFRGASPRIESQSNGDPFTAPTQFAPPPAAPDTPVQNPAVNVPSGQAPTDIFTPRGQRPQPQAPQQTPPLSRNPVTYEPPPPPPAPPPGGSASLPDEILGDSAVITAASPLSPRIAPQPAAMMLAPGEEKIWSLVGMDLEGLSTQEIRMHFDPVSFEVIEAILGPALAIEPAAPPVVAVDRANGIITVRSTDGRPLRFVSGGELLGLKIRGGGQGESFLVLDALELQSAEGIPVAGLIQGGRIAIP